MPFKKVDPKVDFPKLEEDILKYWEENKIFEKSLKKTESGPRYVFYEGPPTANGKPHIGHFITRIFKDVFPRFKTMQGYYVLRKGGWDTHGLPVEVEVEKELGISGKDEIENIVEGDPKASIAKFNELCKKSVWKYVDLWEKMVKRSGHWIDLKNTYITYDKNYIESVWWSLKQLFDKGLLYLGYKVVPYCARCETPLSSHEVAQDYKETEDPSVYVKFPLKNDKNTYVLVWTTTPWTLPGNVALAVDAGIDYLKLDVGSEKLIVASDAAERLGFPTHQGRARRLKGKDLVGLSYEPLYSYLSDRFKDNKNLHTIVSCDFVDTSEGTGIVHTAVMYGEEDFELGKKFNLPAHHLIDTKGRFTKEVTDFSGKFVKEADANIMTDLEKKGLLWKKETILHQYPFCWRCHEPLIYYALESWFINTTKFKSDLLKNNDSVNWVPQHIKDGRMRNWYETLIDWSVSRNRYWGTPLPIWRCSLCDSKLAVGSSQELKSKSKNTRIDWEKFDPHRPWVDEITLECEQCGEKMERTPEVIDAWYDSGSMPFAQWNYPHAGNKEFNSQFPADFISEAVDQTRGWFFSLQAISTMLFGRSPYRNVVVFSHALDESGKKMSKHLGNVVDPWDVFEEHGVDVARWFFFSSVSIGNPYRVSSSTIGEARRRFILILWNVYNFFVTYADLDSWNPSRSEMRSTKSENVLDRWILSRLDELIALVTSSLEYYDTFTASRAIEEFVVKDFSQWFVRRSRDRVGPTASDPAEKQEAYSTYYVILTTLCRLLAPFIPFVSEEMYRNLTGEESVHLAAWPEKLGALDESLNNDMAVIRSWAEQGHAIRKRSGIRVRQPLALAEVYSPKQPAQELVDIICDELNVKRAEWKPSNEVSVSLDTAITQDLKIEGLARELIREIQDERKRVGTRLSDKVKVMYPDTKENREAVEKFAELVKAKTLAVSLEAGEKLQVEIFNDA